MIDRLFLRHPRALGESYGTHLRVAGGFGIRMIGGGLACLVHGVVPALFTSTGSRTVERLHRRMVAGRRGAGIRTGATEPVAEATAVGTAAAGTAAARTGGTDVPDPPVRPRAAAPVAEHLFHG